MKFTTLQLVCILSTLTLAACGAGGGGTPTGITNVSGSKGNIGVTFSGAKVLNTPVYDSHIVTGGYAPGGIVINYPSGPLQGASIQWGSASISSAVLTYYSSPQEIGVQFADPANGLPVSEVTCKLTASSSALQMCSNAHVTFDKSGGKLIFLATPLTNSAQAGTTVTGTLTFPAF